MSPLPPLGLKSFAPPYTLEGNYFSIATVKVAAAGASTVTFAGVPSGYKHLQIRGIAKLADSGSGDLYHQIRYNGDTGSNYSWHMMYGVGTGSVYATGGASTNSMTPYGLPIAGNSGAFGAFVMDVLDYASTTKNKTMRMFTGWDGNGNGDILEASGTWYNSSSPVTSVSFTSPSGLYLENSHFALYGVK